MEDMKTGCANVHDQKDKKRTKGQNTFTSHYKINYRSSNTKPTKNRSQARFPGRVSSSYSTSHNHRCQSYIFDETRFNFQDVMSHVYQLCHQLIHKPSVNVSSLTLKFDRM